MASDIEGPQRRPRVTVDMIHIYEELQAQINFLVKSCSEFDSGDTEEFRRIALAIRIILYDHGQSKSLLHQLNSKDIQFHSYSSPINTANLLSEIPLATLRVSPSGASYLPCLDKNGSPPRLMPFDEWWNEIVYRSTNGLSMKRRDFVLYVANQAGGAHVDPKLDQDFHKIVRENETGWIERLNDDERPIMGIQKSYVRQIGFELIRSLYENQQIIEDRACRR